MIEDSLYSFLTSQSGVTSIVSTRIYPIILPQEPTFPAITYRDDSHDYVESFEGQGGMVDSYYTIDAWSTTIAGAMALGTAIRSALQNTVGNFGNINIHKCIVATGPQTFYEDLVEAYRQSQTFLISHNEG